MSGLAARAAARMLAAASRLLPAQLAPWAEAMARELDEIEDPRAALAFAAGCLRAVLGLAIAARLRSLAAAIRSPAAIPDRRSADMNKMLARPRLLGLICAAGAVALGAAYMATAGAPGRYLAVNAASLVLGAAAWLALRRTAGARLGSAGAAILALAAAMLATAFLGVAVDGASRWVSLGPLTLQISLVAVPAMLVLYARRPDTIGTAGMIAAACALAVQPDRAMAGVLAAGLLGLLLDRPRRLAMLAAAAAMAAFGWTLVIPDDLPAVPYVDRILYTAFDVHPLAGAAVTAGAAMLLLPALAAAARGPSERPALLAFGCCWFAVIAAAMLGNYPTPLVGYGGGAVLGYLLSVALLPGPAEEAGEGGEAAAHAAGAPSADVPASKLRVAQPI